MEETCIHEYVYWAEFQSKRFYQILPQGFNRQLRIPSKFAQNVKELSGIVSLKGPARKIWKVELVKSQEGLCFQNGWSQFVRDNFLEAGNLLVFIYNGHLHFDVSIFDHESFCEKACSFFVGACRVTGRSRDDSEEIPPSARIHHSPSEAPAARDGRPIPSRSTKPLSTKRKFRSDEGEISGSGSSCDEEDGTPLGFKYSVREHKSGRRPATREEKKKVRQLADEAFASSTDESFLVVMKKSHVYKSFLLTIPFDFALKHFPPKDKYCILCCEGRNRTVMFKARQNPAGGGFSKGWADFVLENNIEKDDICFFEFVKPVQKQDKLDIIFNVRIFRAVEEIIPLTCCRTPFLGIRGRKTQRVGARSCGHGRGKRQLRSLS
ncbi:B3 domain-containing protein REM16-like isoform X2 [Macadamia integrifolia]|nr:B3 domain-containing protein REM16-like isoform X2 [Macadamia integrifolia]